MTPALSHFYLARIVLQSKTPLTISSGINDSDFDTLLVRDCNGLPALPGTTIAGVLRHLYHAHYGEEKTSALFGCAGDDAESSRLAVSWGAIHNSKDQPVEGMLLDQDISRLNDPLLNLLKQEHPVVRDHVKITHRGAATHQGKFDQTATPTGCRFSIEISMWSEQAKDPTWLNLLALLSHPLFRLGGSTRRGYGAMACIRGYENHFSLDTKEGFADYSQLGSHFAACSKLKEIPTSQLQKAHLGVTRAKITLTPEDFWRFGGGNDSLQNTPKKLADLLQVTEPLIEWEDSAATIKMKRLVVPASSIKGALAHRLAYHYNALSACFSDDIDDLTDETLENQGVAQLFGYLKSDNDSGQIGHVLIDDIYLAVSEKQIAQLMHNAIDRFTGGTINHALFSEELIFNTPLSFDLFISTDRCTPDDDCKKALQLTLEDLCEGRLALGASSNRGHGYFEGTVKWDDQGTWLVGEAQ